MQQQFDFPFATLEALKSRLNMRSADFDAPLEALLVHVTNAIERIGTGRRLRRWHQRAETFRGGGRIIRVGVPPIAHIDWIRESADRDFEDSDNYEELVEGTDYVIECGTDGELEGQSGKIRRLNQDWLGSPKDPGQVKVQYTGGWKTEGEQDLQDTTTTISSPDRIMDYKIFGGNGLVYCEDTEEINLVDQASDSPPDDVISYRFDLANLLVASWTIRKMALSFSGKWEGGEPYESDWALSFMSHREDPAIKSNGTSLFGHWDYSDGATTSNYSMGHSTTGEETWQRLIGTWSNGGYWTEAKANMEYTLASGSFIAALAHVLAPVGTEDVRIASVQHSEAAKRPSLEIIHNQSFQDPFNVRGDLEHACIVQATHEWNSKHAPGILAESQRGVSIASGAAIKRSPVTLLPEVREIAESYAHMY